MQIDLRKLKHPVSVDLFCKGLESSGEQHLRGYYHFTKLQNYTSMVTPVHVPGGRMSRVLRLTCSQDKNDLTESKIQQRFWFGSFTYGDNETIAIWSMYGGKDALRIRFSYESMLKWYHAPKRIYAVSETGAKTDVSDLLDTVKLIDVGYLSDRPVGFVYHRESRYSFDISALSTDVAPYFKRYAWRTEKEVRLLLVFTTELEGCKWIEVDFDEPLAEIVANPHENILLNPWFGKNGTVIADAPGLSSLRATLSDYTNEVR